MSERHMDRLAIVLVSADVLVEMCKIGPPRYVRVVDHPLPQDTILVRAGHDETGLLRVVVQSESFDTVEIGGHLPVLPETQFEHVFDPSLTGTSSPA